MTTKESKFWKMIAEVLAEDTIGPFDSAEEALKAMYLETGGSKRKSKS